MTADPYTQYLRQITTPIAAKNKLRSQYDDNNNLYTDFGNWLDTGGYENFGQDSNFGMHTTSRFDQNGMTDDMINDFTEYNKRKFENYMKKEFSDLGAGDKWLDKYWNTASDDELVNNFVNTNYNNALEQLDRALNRGTLSQKGYNTALNDLNTKRSSVNTQIGDIGQNIISGYKNSLINEVNDFNKYIDNYNLNKYGMYDATKVHDNLNSLYNKQKEGFEGQFNIATDGLVPFDISGIIGDARVAQGINNTQSDPLLTAIEDTEKKKDQKVGLGNKGLF